LSQKRHFSAWKYFQNHNTGPRSTLTHHIDCRKRFSEIAETLQNPPKPADPQAKEESDHPDPTSANRDVDGNSVTGKGKKSGRGKKVQIGKQLHGSKILFRTCFTFSVSVSGDFYDVMLIS
jgi:hypothetical protein